MTRRIARTVVQGFVSPAGWDEDGQVSSVCVVSEPGGPVFILTGGAGDEVLGHLKHYVAVTGRIQKRGRVSFMRVESVVRIPDPDGAPEQE